MHNHSAAGNFHPPSEDRFVSGIEPGQMVRHPTQPDWGTGQVQSVIGSRVTVNFEHAGKVLVNARIVDLQVLG
jgi:FKBP-type peptidyl-prolyl cis-trans isomerase 2